MRILLKALRKTFTSATLVGFVQYLILGFLISFFPFQVIFGEFLLWSGYLFLFLLIFINRLELISKTVDEGKGDITFLSEEELDKEKTTLLTRVFKKTFYGRFKFIVSLIFVFICAVIGGIFEGLGMLLAFYLILFMFNFLFDESGFLHGSSSGIDFGGGGGGGGGGDGGGCGGGGCGGDGGGE